MPAEKLRSQDEITHKGKPLREILEAHRGWLKSRGNEGTRADLSRADLSGATLRGADLSVAELRGANLCGADLSVADLRGANLRGADLSSANLGEANLRVADLSRANLSRANLVGANLSVADLSGADLNACRLGYTVIADCDLSSAIGLETIHHDAPSSIGVDTILKSQGKIPEAFLKGAGLPDIWIDYVKALVTSPIEFYSCFISHSSTDQEFCDRLYADLQAKSVRCWYFPEDAIWGKSVWGEIDRAVRVYDKLVVVCSEHSLNSAAVIREIERALQREDREKREILFPIRIDDYLFDKWEHERKADVIRKVVGDFRSWKDHDLYKKNFDKLLKALNRKQPE